MTGVELLAVLAALAVGVLWGVPVGVGLRKRTVRRIPVGTRLCPMCRVYADASPGPPARVRAEVVKRDVPAIERSDG